MSETPKTHRERAEEAVERIRDPRGLSTEPGKTTAYAIALLTYPTELAKAARSLCEEIESGPKHTGMTGEHLRRVRAALALYEPEAENG